MLILLNSLNTFLVLTLNADQPLSHETPLLSGSSKHFLKLGATYF